MIDKSVYQFVVSSSVRVDLLELLSAGPETTNALIEDLDASKSAVYTALADLERRQVLFEGADGWELTGQGRLVLDVIEQWESLDTLIEADRDYWANHRTDVLPRPFRGRLPELGEYDVVRSEPPNVRAHSQATISRLESADHCWSTVPISVPQYTDAFPDTPDSRVVYSPCVIDQLYEEFAAGDRDSVRTKDAAPIRVHPVEFGMSVADEFVLLALRPVSGEMVDSVLIATDDNAIRWGNDLYAFLWDDAEPLDAYLEREHGYRP